MKKLLIAAGVAAFAIAGPAAADPGKGHKSHHQHSRYYEGRASANWWGDNRCPPGLVKKRNGCLPPGIAKQRYLVGQRFTNNYNPWSYNQIPLDWRNQYNLDPNFRYYYRDGYLYSVDPSTRLVQSVIQALIR